MPECTETVGQGRTRCFEGVTSSKMTQGGIDGGGRATPTSDPHDATTAVLSTPDLLLDILRPLIDGDFMPVLCSLSLISKDFHRATSSDQFWREVCRQRWKGKWGYHARWERAVADYSRCLTVKQQRGTSKDTAADDEDTFWRERYFFEERDSTRDRISAEELSSLVFDFRFWIGEPTLVDGGRIVVESGLLRSVSTEIGFSDPSPCEERVAGISWTARGRLTGHPSPEPGIEWFLDERSNAMQWGYAPDLWPRGNVQRLKNWGWQIMNPNVCLRAIDPAPSSSEMDATKSGEEDGEGKCNNDLWRDLLDSLENVPLRNTPNVNGQPVTVNLPRMFIERYELVDETLMR
ncbi:hypothetical protein ACHAXT_000383 [Thalassiosira profunda]